MENSVNPYLVEKTIQRKVVTKTTVEETITAIDWSKVPNGTYMTAKIEGRLAKGVLYKGTDGNMWICQNTRKGNTAPFKFGFKYSWSFRQCSDGVQHTSDVSDIQFPPKPASLKIPAVPVQLKVGTYKALVTKDSVTVGCQTISKAQVKAVWDAMNKMK